MGRATCAKARNDCLPSLSYGEALSNIVAPSCSHSPRPTRHQISSGSLSVRKRWPSSPALSVLLPYAVRLAAMRPSSRFVVRSCGIRSFLGSPIVRLWCVRDIDVDGANGKKSGRRGAQHRYRAARLPERQTRKIYVASPQRM